MTKRRLVAEQWNQFSRAVLQPNTPDFEEQEMRRAFYAGAHAVMFRVIAVLAPESEPTPADLKVMDDLHEELQEFARDLAEGRA